MNLANLETKGLAPDLTASLTKLGELVALVEQSSESWEAYHATVQQELADYVLQVATGGHPSLLVTDPKFQLEVVRYNCFLELLSTLISNIKIERN